MVEKKKDRIMWGVSLVIIGIFFLFGNFLGIPSNISLIFGIPLFTIGIIIMLNKSEDTIEKRKDLNN